MVQILPEDPTRNVWGKVGRDFGLTLADQLPKYIERGRLANTLESIGREGGTPIQNLAKLTKAGATDTQIQQYMPYLKSAGQEQYARQQGGGQNAPIQQGGQPAQGQPQGQPPQMQGQPQGQSAQMGAAQQQRIETPQVQQSLLQPDYVPTQQDINQRAASNQNPNLSFEEKQQIAAQEFQRENDQRASQRALATSQKAEKQGLITALETKLQKKTGKTAENLYALLPAESINRAANNAEIDYINSNGKKTIDQVAEDQANKLNDLSKKIVTLRNNIEGRPAFSKLAEQTKKDVTTLRNSFEEAGELETFYNEIQTSLDVGPHLAAQLTWPPKSDLVNTINKMPSDDDAASAAVQIGKMIGKDDSLFGIGKMLNERGMDDVDVINSLKHLNDIGYINLNERQQREIAEYYPAKPELRDIWSTMGYAWQVPGIAIIDYLTGTKRKVGPVEKVKRYFGKE